MLGGSQELKKRPTILLFINLPQDLDLLLPLAMRLQEICEFRLQVMVSTKAWRCSPRIATLLAAANIEPKLVSHKATVAGLRPSLKGIQAVITASESNAIAHRGPHTLTCRANRRGIPTYTLQHGFENVGINYFDTEFPVGAIRFASQTCFIWGSAEDLPSETPVETREKCVSVGCPKFVLAPHISPESPPPSIPLLKETLSSGLIAVFENLHWCRYSNAYRQQFLENLIQTACAFPQITFLVKPHHTGQWLTQHSDTLMPAVDNLIVVDPKMPEWEAFTAPALIQDADAVITTPSTVALDAARADCPVAIVAHTLTLNNYEPLPLLRDYQDWQALALQVSQAANPLCRGQYDDLLAKTRAFLVRHILPGDAVGKIVAKLTADIRS